jgi:hypothetical protein
VNEETASSNSSIVCSLLRWTAVEWLPMDYAKNWLQSGNHCFINAFKACFSSPSTDTPLSASSPASAFRTCGLILDGIPGPTACSYKLFNTTGGFHFNHYLCIQHTEKYGYPLLT